MISLENPLPSVRPIMLALVLLVLGGCAKKSGTAVVLDKEHIAAAEMHETPAPATPASDSGIPDEALKPDEIVVDGYVMKKDARGTAKDPRATAHERWLVRVELISGRRKFTVPADREQYDKLKPGDRVEISYREGKYTGTAWSVEIK